MTHGAKVCAERGHAGTREEDKGSWIAVVCTRCGATVDAKKKG